MSTAIIVQARVGSTRLPHKMMHPFFGEIGLLEYLLRRLKHAALDLPVILAIPESTENQVLAEVAESLEIPVGVGAEDDVLGRFMEVSKQFGHRRIIRVCADNPFLDMGDLKVLIREFSASDADYLAFRLENGTPTIKSHYGFWAEGVTVEALEKAAALISSQHYREHVTNFIYTHPENFKIRFLNIDPEFERHPWARFTVDTEKDFTNMQVLARQFPPEIDFEALEVLNLAKENGEIRESMRGEILGNRK